ncbi:MAG: CDP-alcohol phosphatidyltransferase family protein [Ruminococcaceae bacterium]|nr:CDP-alcohol phosphatidyltransferase family protein [Oscillospiraceae bacterium]
MSDNERQQIEQAQRADTDRIFTLPNILSFVRLLLIPLIVILYEDGYPLWSFLVLFLSGVTDVVDGWIARTFHLVSDFGKAIDPVADKLTQLVVLLCLLDSKYWWVIGALVMKELVIGIMTLMALRKTHSVYSAGWYGKLCTMVIYLSMGTLILWKPVFGMAAPNWFVLADSILIVSLIFLSFGKYFVYFAKILKEARNARKAA